MRETGEMFAKALYSLAEEEGAEELILTQIEAANEAFGENEALLIALDAPQLSLDERLGTIDEVFQGAHPYLINTVKLLAEKCRCAAFPYMAKRYRSEFNRAKKVFEVTAITAEPLSAENEKKLAKKLENCFGGRIFLRKKLDPSILGGITIMAEGVLIDGSVRGRLEAIKKEIVR